ncbi:MAG: ASKHA domain-containing protein [Lachnospiraceae bacterium]
MKITEFSIEINQKNVFNLIDCYSDSPIYEAVIEEYEEMLQTAYDKIMPSALLEFGELADGLTPVLFCITSVGKLVSDWSTLLFAKGNYLGGMLADAMADDYLFQMDHQLSEQVIALCKGRKMGVKSRLEAPQDIGMEVQKLAWKVTGAQKQSNIQIKESYMYDPVKTTCQVYVLEAGTDEYKIEHNCSKCPNVTCKVRNLQTFQIEVKTGAETIVIPCKERQSLLDAMIQENRCHSAVCGGKGTCGKCKIQVLQGEIEISQPDADFFTTQELKEGFRLACKAYPKQNCTIVLHFRGEEEFSIVSEYHAAQYRGEQISGGHYGIATDIGTTTIAMQLVELETKTVVDTYTAMNQQRAYGADVISRIESSNRGKAGLLRTCICEELQKGIHSLLDSNKVEIEHMTIGANTTMIHLLMGYSCKNLGVFPFTPVNIDTIDTSYFQLFQSEEYDFPITLFPGISTYVGGDIVAGLYACGFDQKEKPSVLIDLGTNGEMAIGNKEKILTTSTAAGPAFEGGNITDGIGSIPGAICNATMKDGIVKIRTIGDTAPVGICGTGVIDLTYELMKAEFLDETGLLEEGCFEEGIPLGKSQQGKTIAFYQKDIREIQLAKSAVRAGLETLLIHYGVTYEEIDKIYIAGGFGYKMDIEKAIGIGLLPKECETKIETVGNSSLKGACCYLTEADAGNRVKNIVNISEEIQLANDKNFNEFYMEYMYF